MYADLGGMGASLDAAAQQTALITNEGLDSGFLDITDSTRGKCSRTSMKERVEFVWHRF